MVKIIALDKSLSLHFRSSKPYSACSPSENSPRWQQIISPSGKRATAPTLGCGLSEFSDKVGYLFGSKVGLLIICSNNNDFPIVDFIYRRDIRVVEADSKLFKALVRVKTNKNSHEFKVNKKQLSEMEKFINGIRSNLNSNRVVNEFIYINKKKGSNHESIGAKNKGKQTMIGSSASKGRNRIKKI